MQGAKIKKKGENIMNESFETNEQKAQNNRLDFAGIRQVITKSVEKAYRDACRPLRYYGNVKDPSAYTNACKELIAAFKEYFKHDVPENPGAYDDWHRGVMRSLVDIYHDKNHTYDKKIDTKEEFNPDTFTLGVAQKWLNMSMKNIYCFSDILALQPDFCVEIENDISGHFKYCHIPLDSYVIKNAFNKGIVDENVSKKWKKSDAWSKIGEVKEGNYIPAFEEGYKKYMMMQNCLADHAKKNNYPCPLDLEPELWNEGRDVDNAKGA